MELENKVIWIYWNQGWADAPLIAKKCLHSWILKNPNWKVVQLCDKTIDQYVDTKKTLIDFQLKEITVASFSDILRISLLYKFGGVWVDSTLMCRKPLDEWLDLYYEHGFFAFDKPGADRMVSSWFLMAQKGNYIIDQWYKKTLRFWYKRHDCAEYFWFHYQFNELYNTDLMFKICWDNTPKMSADAPHYFLPYTDTFFEKLSPEKIEKIKSIQSPVFKLTHKYDQGRIQDDMLISYLLNEEQTMKKIKILVTWYGSFDKNGTLGDYLSLKTLLYSLKGAAIEYDYASYKHFDDLPGNSVSLEEANPENYQVLIFCCGPIIASHTKFKELIEKFKTLYKIGIGVSLFPKEHENFCNPFNFVLPRENGEINFEDIALIAPKSAVQNRFKKDKKGFTVGVILRNKQFEYGESNCRSDESNAYINKLANNLTISKKSFFHTFFKKTQEEGRVIIIDNHLETSKLSPQEIELQYFKCDIILTTRFHGSMLALRNDVPFIAIDQISGGAKVHGLLSKTGYPYVWKINNVNYCKLKNAAMDLLKMNQKDKIFTVKQKSELEAQKTLESLHAHLHAYLNDLTVFCGTQNTQRRLS